MQSKHPPRIATCRQVSQISSGLILVPLHKPSMGLRFCIKIRGGPILGGRQDDGIDPRKILGKYSTAKGSPAASSSGTLTWLIVSNICSSPGMLRSSTWLKSFIVWLPKARITLAVRELGIVSVLFNNKYRYRQLCNWSTEDPWEILAGSWSLPCRRVLVIMVVEFVPVQKG